MFASVREFQPDVILLDMQQEFQRTIALTRISRAWRRETPIIVSGDSFSPDEIKGLKEEMVSDVVSTGGPFELLAFSLESHARCGRRMRDSRTQDFLSGVHQYSSFMEAMETELKWASRSGKPMSVAVFGLDNVIELNRKAGEREVGRLSEALCQLIQGQMQERDRLGQVGGCTYAGFFTHLDGQVLQRVLSGLQYRFSTLSFFHKRGKLNGTFSAGISRFPNLSDRNYLLEAALNALLRAREFGGNRIISTF